jgi:acetyl-CoA acetyltransferase
MGGYYRHYNPLFLSSELLQSITLIDNFFEFQDVDFFILGNAYPANLGTNFLQKLSTAAKIPTNVARTQISNALITGVKVVIDAILHINGGSTLILCQTMEHMSSSQDIHKQGPRLSLITGQDSFFQNSKFVNDVYLINEELGTASQHAEKLGSYYKITPKVVNDWVFTSYTKILRGQELGFYEREISPIPINVDKQNLLVNIDEKVYEIHNIKDDLFFSQGSILSPEAIAESADGAAICTVLSEEGLKKSGMIPQARVKSFKVHYSENTNYLNESINCIISTIRESNLKIKDIGLFEIHEDTAITPLVIQQELKIEPNIINPYGGSLCFGNPIAVSGMRLIITACNQMNLDRSIRYALVHVSDATSCSVTLILENTF